MPKSSWWQLVLKSVITLALFVWLVNYANVSFIEVFSNLAQASPWWLLLAMLLFLLHTIVIYLAWHRSLSLFGIHVPLQQTAPLFAFSALTKYVPGGIWHAGSRVWVLGVQGQSRVSALFSVLLETLYSLGTSALMLCLLFGTMQTGFLPAWVDVVPASVSVIIGLLLLACMLTPALYRLVFDWYYARKLGADKVSNFATGRLLELVLLHCGALLVFVVGYYVSFIGFVPELQVDLIQFAFIVLLATFSGFIAIFAPAGLGVRESVLYLLFATIIDSPLLVTLCLAPRLLLLVAEIILFGLTRIGTRAVVAEDQAGTW